jgi:hypothetical protein
MGVSLYNEAGNLPMAGRGKAIGRNTDPGAQLIFGDRAGNIITKGQGACSIAPAAPLAKEKAGFPPSPE